MHVMSVPRMTSSITSAKMIMSKLAMTQIEKYHVFLSFSWVLVAVNSIVAISGCMMNTVALVSTVIDESIHQASALFLK